MHEQKTSIMWSKLFCTKPELKSWQAYHELLESVLVSNGVLTDHEQQDWHMPIAVKYRRCCLRFFPTVWCASFWRQGCRDDATRIGPLGSKYSPSQRLNALTQVMHGKFPSLVQLTLHTNRPKSSACKARHRRTATETERFSIMRRGFFRRAGLFGFMKPSPGKGVSWISGLQNK